MALAIATTVALCLWIVLWALGISSFDGLMLSVGIVLVVGTLRSLGQYLPGANGKRRGAGRANAPGGGW